MTTTEREITEPVDLCLPDGRRLAPTARAWSRHPLHTANLRGRPFRTKRWDYWAVLSDDIALAVTYGDVGYLGVATMWWVDLRTGAEGGRDAPAPRGRGLHLPDRPGTAPRRHRSRHLVLDLIDDDRGTTLRARWDERDGRPGTLDVRIEKPPGHESLNVVIPWSETLFQYTSKHQARPARGVLRVGGEVHRLGRDAGPAWGVLDVGRGRWPYATRWNWGGGAGAATDGTTVVGLQFGGKWTEGTGHTENGVIVDGRLTKIGTELEWDYDWDAPLRPWRVRHPDGSLDVTLTPRHDRHTKVQALVLATEVHQVFGTWAGHVTTDAGTEVRIDGIPGFAEESRSRW